MTLITRRNVLAMSAATAIAGACSPNGRAPQKRVAVIGAGIVGASIAYHLAKAGAAVTVLDRHSIATRASRGTFAWLNASWAKQPRHYHRLNQLGLAGWQEIARDLDIPVKWGGSLEWFDSADRQSVLENQIAEQVEWGEPARMVGRGELARLEPNVVFGTAQSAALSPNDGALDPVQAAHILLKQAEALGTQLVMKNAVNAVTQENGVSILETDQGAFETDTFVLATGADPLATERLAGLDIPQRSTPGVIVVTKPMKPVLNRIVVAPGVHIHQRPDGRVVLGEQDGAPQNEAHAKRLANRPNRFPAAELAAQHASRILAVAQQYCPMLADAMVEDVFIGWRPLPLDGHPVMGFSPARAGAYIAISHSGVSLAPILGRMAAQEIIEGIELEMLAPYRPDRTFEQIRRY